MLTDVEKSCYSAIHRIVRIITKLSLHCENYYQKYTCIAWSVHLLKHFEYQQRTQDVSAIICFNISKQLDLYQLNNEAFYFSKRFSIILKGNSLHGHNLRIGSFCLPSHRHDAHRIFFLIVSYNRIGISVKGDTCVLLGLKGLN